MLVAAGVDPQMVGWFGRWRSESARSYTEDARALAPQAERLAGTVWGAAPATPAPGAAGRLPPTPDAAPFTPAGGSAGGVRRTPGWAGGGVGTPGTPAPWPQTGGQACSSAASGEAPASPIASQKWVEQRLAAAEGETATYPLRLASNKLHFALRRIGCAGAQGMVHIVRVALRARPNRLGQAASIGRGGIGFSVRQLQAGGEQGADSGGRYFR